MPETEMTVEQQIRSAVHTGIFDLAPQRVDEVVREVLLAVRPRLAHAEGIIESVTRIVEHRVIRYARRGGIRAVPVADLRRALGLPPDPVDCNQLRTAVWCPLHGDCTCPVHRIDDPSCPLHAPSSDHGEGS